MLLMNVISFKRRIRQLQISVGEYGHSESELLVVSNGDSKPSKEWVLDSGCTFHVSQSGLVFDI